MKLLTLGLFVIWGNLACAQSELADEIRISEIGQYTLANEIRGSLNIAAEEPRIHVAVKSEKKFKLKRSEQNKKKPTPLNIVSIPAG